MRSPGGEPQTDFPKIVFLTDIDGTIAHSKTFEFDETKPAAAKLGLSGVPTVIVTSKSLEAALIYVRELEGLGYKGAPLISFELGSALATSKDLVPEYDYVDSNTGLAIIELSRSVHTEIKRADDVVPERCRDSVLDVRFADDKLISMMTGLPLMEAHLFKRRRYDLTLLIKNKECIEEIVECGKGLGLNVIVGARFLHVLTGRGKVEVILKIKELLPDFSVSQIAYAGDTVPDKEPLESADLAFVVPQPDFSLKVRPQRSDYVVPPYPAPRGWVWIADFLINHSNLLISETKISSDSKKEGP